jgi:hypothetical protein
MQRILSNRGFKIKDCGTNELLFEKQISESTVDRDASKGLPKQSSDLHVEETKALAPASVDIG